VRNVELGSCWLDGGDAVMALEINSSIKKRLWLSTAGRTSLSMVAAQLP